MGRAALVFAQVTIRCQADLRQGEQHPSAQRVQRFPPGTTATTTSAAPSRQGSGGLATLLARSNRFGTAAPCTTGEAGMTRKGRRESHSCRRLPGSLWQLVCSTSVHGGLSQCLDITWLVDECCLVARNACYPALDLYLTSVYWCLAHDIPVLRRVKFVKVLERCGSKYRGRKGGT